MEFSLHLAMAPMGSLPREVGYARFYCPFDGAVPSTEAWEAGCMPIFTDRTPYAGQSAKELVGQWAPRLQGCPGVVLDFQQTEQPGLWDFVQELRSLLPCPAAAPPDCAGPSGPVFLPPIPPDTLPEDVLAPWQGREIWLDLGGYGKQLTLTPTGCRGEDWDAGEEAGFPDEHLCCHYRITKPCTDTFRFLLWRSGSDLFDLMEKTSRLGVRHFVGLYPELQRCGFPQAHRLPGSDR